MTKQLQHYVPEMLLKRFVNNTGNFYVYRKQTPKLVYTTPRNFFSEHHIYSITDAFGNRDTALEQKYSAIESKASTVLDYVISAAKADNDIDLTTGMRRTIDEFIWCQMTRVPDVHECILPDFYQLYTGHLKQYETERRPLSDDERAFFHTPDQEARIKKNIMNRTLKEGDYEEVINLINSIGLQVCMIGVANKSFVIGSNPITTSGHDGRELFADPDDQLWFPISSDIAICLTGTISSKRRLSLRDEVYIRNVSVINQAVFEQSSIVAASSKDLISSLSSRHRKHKKKM
jgi:hypothetical protein